VNGDEQRRLEGTSALVTGGSTGLGRAMVEALAAAGARVVLTSRSEERAARAAEEASASTGGEVVGLALDTRDADAVERVVAEAWTWSGGIDLLVDNAGLGMRTVNPDFLQRPQGFWEVDPAGFRAVVDTNLTGYFLVARAATRRMLEARHGRIVVISMNHATMRRRGFVPYGPSRAGAEALALIMAEDLADTPVRVNMLLPGGATATGMTADLELPDGAELLPPEVMAGPIVWLASPAAADAHGLRIDASTWTEPAAG
jgi:gluconate 5-dehydrogenase